ncbi:hypothetical protein Tco_0905809 [Tanacetum coccineum]
MLKQNRVPDKIWEGYVDFESDPWPHISATAKSQPSDSLIIHEDLSLHIGINIAFIYEWADLSCIKVALDFLSPENVGECIRLTEDFRVLPQNHKVKKMVLYAVEAAVKDLNKTKETNALNLACKQSPPPPREEVVRPTIRK